VDKRALPPAEHEMLQRRYHQQIFVFVHTMGTVIRVPFPIPKVFPPLHRSTSPGPKRTPFL
jgi:hypothetical protein